MEGNTPLLPGTLDELMAAHPEVEVVPGTAGGRWHATVDLHSGREGYMHAADEAELLAKLTAALGG
jgi:hypothetical protein